VAIDGVLNTVLARAAAFLPDRITLAAARMVAIRS
jgi:hypothetical protein